MSLIYSMKMFYFWNFAFLDLREKSKKDLRSFFFFFKTSMDSKSTYKHNNKANRDNVRRIATNGCSLISDYSQEIPTNNPQMALPEQVYVSSGNISSFYIRM